MIGSSFAVHSRELCCLELLVIGKFVIDEFDFEAGLVLGEQFLELCIYRSPHAIITISN